MGRGLPLTYPLILGCVAVFVQHIEFTARRGSARTRLVAPTLRSSVPGVKTVHKLVVPVRIRDPRCRETRLLSR